MENDADVIRGREFGCLAVVMTVLIIFLAAWTDYRLDRLEKLHGIKTPLGQEHP